MKIKLTSVFVDDQEKALRFYTEVLGFTKKADFRQGSSEQVQWPSLMALGGRMRGARRRRCGGIADDEQRSRRPATAISPAGCGRRPQRRPSD